MYNVGVVGCGYWGSKMIDRVASNRRFNLKHVADKNVELSENIGASYKCQHHDNIDNILWDDDVDIVGVFVHSAAHFELCKKALERGKHVWTTKPFVLSTEECGELIALAVENNLQIFLDCTYLFSPVVREAKKLVDFEPVYIQYINANRWTGNRDPGMSVVEDLAPHIISILCYLFPHREIVTESVHTVSVAAEDDMVFVRLKCGSTMVNLTLGWASFDKQRLHCIVGKDKMIKFGIGEELCCKEISSDGCKIKDDRNYTFRCPGEPLSIEVDEIADSLDGIKPFVVNLKMIYKITKVVEEINSWMQAPRECCSCIGMV